jgi:hypothetical protein
MTDREYIEALNNAVADSEVQAIREYTSKAVALSLERAGQALWVSSWLSKDRCAEGVALVIQMSAELATALVNVLEHANWYAAASLIRQLIETEYLMWTFAEAKGTAKDWLDASPEQLRQTWTPAAMRKRSGGRFRDHEYWTHCDLGGHPAPKARFLLPEHDTWIDRRFVWVDFLQHMHALWRDTGRCLDALDHSALGVTDTWRRAGSSLAVWREREAVTLLDLPPDTPAS